MRNIEIDLAQPFEKVLATVLSLPAGCRNAVADRLGNEAELKQVLRGLYEAANGRQVETPIGFIAIAPPVAEFLKAKPFQAATQIEFLIAAATRIICGPPPYNTGMRPAKNRDDIPAAYDGLVKASSGESARPRERRFSSPSRKTPALLVTR
jgi:hypothetical protein